MRRLLLLVLLLVPLAAHASSADDGDGDAPKRDWAGFPSHGLGFHVVADLGFEHGQAPGDRTYWRYVPAVTFLAGGLDAGREGLTTSGHQFGQEFDFTLGWRSGEHTLSGPTIPPDAIPIPLYMDLGYYALVRLAPTRGLSLIAYAGPQGTFGAPTWYSGGWRLALTTGLRAVLGGEAGGIVADLRVQPVDVVGDPIPETLNPDDPSAPTLSAPDRTGFNRLDYRLSLLFAGSEGLIAGLRLGLAPMRTRGFYGHEWSLSLVGGL